MTKEETLLKDRAEKQNLFNDINACVEKRRQELFVEASKILDNELGKELRSARETLAVADKLWREEFNKNCVENAKSKLPYPVGTRVVEWRPLIYVCGKAPYKRTGQMGIVQIFQKGDGVPSNYGPYKTPEPGTIIVRLIKNNGDLGLKFERWSDFWCPEGTEHKYANR